MRIKTGYYLELLPLETTKLLGNPNDKITKDENGKNLPHSEITGAVLVHYNILNNGCQQDSRVLQTFVSNKPFGQLLDISPKTSIFLKFFDSNFSCIKLFTDRNSNVLDMKDKINIVLVIN